MKNTKALISLMSLVVVILVIGIAVYVKADNKSDFISVNQVQSENGITLTLDQLLLEDKKTTISYHMKSDKEKFTDMVLSIDGKKLNSLSSIGDGVKDSYNYEALFDQPPYKIGDTLNITFDIYDRTDVALSQKDSFTFSVPIKEIFKTTEILLDKEVNMQRGNPKMVHKALITAEKLHIFHEVMKAEMTFETPEGKIFAKQSVIGLNNAEEISSIPIESKISSGILHIAEEEIEIRVK